jgi:hypothetical protein
MIGRISVNPIPMEYTQDISARFQQIGAIYEISGVMGSENQTIRVAGSKN